MSSLMPGESSHHSASGSVPSRNSHERPEEVARWYFSRKEIEENSPSRRDGIDFKKETYLRKSYCTFLQDLGMKLKVPQVTIATAIIFCHRFFIRQSHAKNDRRTVATVCMFLAGKVEETPRPLKDVIMVSYEIIHKKDPAAAQRIKQKDVYEQQKELILLGEKVVLSTLGFDLNVHHPYKPLVEAIKKFKVAQNALAQVAWNFVNDGLRTSLCLQFKPHHIAAGAIFLAAKFLKVKLPSDGEKVWWQEFDVTPRQLEEVSNQMLELYEQNRVPPSQGSEVDSSAGGGGAHRAPSRNPATADDHASRQTSSRPPREYSNSDSHGASSRPPQNQNNDNGSGGMGSVITDNKMDTETKESDHPDEFHPKDDVREVSNKHKPGTELAGVEDVERTAGDRRDEKATHKPSSLVGTKADVSDGPVGQSPKEAIKLIRDKVKAKLEKSKKLGERTKKKDLMDEDDLIERELEDGLELAVEDERTKQKKTHHLSKTDNSDHDKEHGEIADGNHSGIKGHVSRGLEMDNAEEGEMVDDASPVMNSRKRKGGSSPDRQSESRKRPDFGSSHVDREHKRHAQENHL